MEDDLFRQGKSTSILFKRHRSIDLAASELTVLCQFSVVAHASNTLLWLVDPVHEGYIDQSDYSIDELAFYHLPG